MRDLAGRTAFITVGACGIGLAMGEAFVDADMNVMLADIETGALARAVNDLGPRARGVICDVADPAVTAAFDKAGRRT